MKLAHTLFELTEAQRIADKRIRNLKDFPGSIFLSTPSSFGFIDYAFIASSELFKCIMEMACLSGGEGFSFMTIDPDPAAYYLNLLGWIPVASFSRNDKFDEFKEFLLYPPGGSKADAIAYRADKIIITSVDGSFVIYGDRSYEIAVISSFTEKVQIGIGGNLAEIEDIIMDIDMAYDHIHLNSGANISRSKFIKSWG